jgi:hypothetical protein
MDTEMRVEECWREMIEYMEGKLYCDIELIPMPDYAEKLSIVCTPDRPDFVMTQPADILHDHMFKLMLNRVYCTYVNPAESTLMHITRILGRLMESGKFCAANFGELCRLGHEQFIGSILQRIGDLEISGAKEYVAQLAVHMAEISDK